MNSYTYMYIIPATFVRVPSSSVSKQDYQEVKNYLGNLKNMEFKINF